MLTRIKKLYHHLFSYEAQARKAGVHLGQDNLIESKFWSSEPYLITIGSHCQITEHVALHTHGGAAAARATHPRFDCFGKVVIGDYVYLGCGSMVMPGVTIGNNVLVAAGSVVTKSIPSNMVVAGNPARFICTLQDYIDRNQPYNLESKGMSPEQKKALLLSLPDEKFIQKKMLELPHSPDR